MGAGVGGRSEAAASVASKLGSPSRFWRKLGAEHAVDLERYGFDQEKRRLAFRYFSWLGADCLCVDGALS